MVLFVSKQIGVYLLSTTVGVTLGAYGSKYVSDTTFKIIGNLLAGGL